MYVQKIEADGVRSFEFIKAVHQIFFRLPNS